MLGLADISMFTAEQLLSEAGDVRDGVNTYSEN